MKLVASLFVWITATTLCAVPAPTKTDRPDKVVREFFAYLAASDHTTVAGPDNHIVRSPEIGTDPTAQEKWLSHDLRESLRRANKYIRRHHPKVGDIPITEFDSGSFRFAWDPPGKFVITRTTEATFTAIVAGRFIWGPDQQYAGSVRNGYFILVFEDGAWRVSDIQADPYPFDQYQSSLTRTLKSFH